MDHKWISVIVLIKLYRVSKHHPAAGPYKRGLSIHITVHLPLGHR